MRTFRLFCFFTLLGFGLAGAGDRIDSFNGDRVEQWRPLVAKIFPAEEVDDVLSVMACESSGNPDARYMEEWGLESVGLMQINRGWLSGWDVPEWAITSHNGEPVDLADPAINLQAAKWVRHYEDSTGLRPWSQWACQPQIGTMPRP